jgi:MFS transporter, UMF1 family
MTSSSAAAPPPGRLPAAAWVLYDLANTVYAAVLTYLFTPYAKATLGDLRWHGAVTFASMLVAGLLVPVLGALADQTARTRGYLSAATLVCIAATAGLGLGLGGAWLLACYFVANVSYNLGLLFYNSLLPSVAAPGREGRLSGLGTGLGYLGTILVLVLLYWPLRERPRESFPLAAAMFLLLALPCLVLVRDRRPPRSVAFAAAAHGAIGQLRSTLHDLPRHRALCWFLAGNFCLVDVLNTAIAYFAAFTLGVFTPAGPAEPLSLFGTVLDADHGPMLLLLVCALVLNGLALPFGILQGPWTDRAPLTVMRVSALALLGALLGGVVFGGRSPEGYLLSLCVLGAFGLSGIWTAGRKVVLLLAPPGRTGEYFGLYGITVKLSVIGSLVYGFVDHAHGSKPAMLAQSIQLLLGLLCLCMVRMPTAPGAPAAPRP